MDTDMCLQYNQWLCTAAEEWAQTVSSQRFVASSQNTNTQFISCTGQVCSDILYTCAEIAVSSDWILYRFGVSGRYCEDKM